MGVPATLKLILSVICRARLDVAAVAALAAKVAAAARKELAEEKAAANAKLSALRSDMVSFAGTLKPLQFTICLA